MTATCDLAEPPDKACAPALTTEGQSGPVSHKYSEEFDPEAIRV